VGAALIHDRRTNGQAEKRAYGLTVSVKESAFNVAGNNNTYLDNLGARYFYQIKFGLCRQIFIKVLNIKVLSLKS
jgi:hypothetical protein